MHKNVQSILLALASLFLIALLLLTTFLTTNKRLVNAEESSPASRTYLPLVMNFDFDPIHNALFVFSDRDGTANDQSFIYTMQGDGSNLTQVTLGALPDLSPDGTQISYFLSEELYVVNGDGSNPTNISNSPGWDADPDWSPDGTRIAFRAARDGNAEIYTMNPDGSDPINLTDNVAWDGAPDWSPDGTKIAFVSDRTGARNIFVMDADGSNVIQLTNYTDTNVWASGPSWSPDGSQIAFSAVTGSSDDDIWVMNADGSSQTVIVNTPAAEFGPIWSPDGSLLAYSANSDADPIPRIHIASVGNQFNPFSLFEGTVSNWIDNSTN